MPYKVYYVYILHCNDGTYYTGITNNLEIRVLQHEAGIDPKAYTFKRRPVELQFYAEFTNVYDCISFEKKLKKWSGKKKKALIEENWDRLKLLSNCRNESHSKNKGPL